MKNKHLHAAIAITVIAIAMIFQLSKCDLDSAPEDTPQPVFPPTVITGAVVDVTTSSAVSGGDVSSEGSSSVTARGVCWGTIQNPTTNDSLTSDGSGTGSFTSSITGLNANTQYYLRAYAINQQGTSYGSNVSFTTTTAGMAPAVATNAITDVTDTSAVCGGNITSEGTSPVVIRGVCWSTSNNPNANDPHTNDGGGTGVYTSMITGLSPGTQYFVRAFATNSEGTAYGFVETFTTPGGSGTSGNPCPDMPVFTDPRDGQEYPTVLIGTQCWLRKNINYPTGNSWCYNNSAANCNIYGRLYDWESALNACPAATGWHLPSNNDLLILVANVGSDPAGQLKEEGTTHWLDPNTGATNSSGFTALPGGFWDPGNNNFFSMGARGGFWSSTEKAPSSPLAWYLYMVNYNTTAYNFDNNKTYGFSVRCLRD